MQQIVMILFSVLTIGQVVCPHLQYTLMELKY